MLESQMLLEYGWSDSNNFSEKMREMKGLPLSEAEIHHHHHHHHLTTHKVVMVSLTHALINN